jgi:hypothetical protein
MSVSRRRLEVGQVFDLPLAFRQARKSRMFSLMLALDEHRSSMIFRKAGQRPRPTAAGIKPVENTL